MKNITAAEQDTSVSALVTRYLERLSETDETFDRLEALQHRVQVEITGFRRAIGWTSKPRGRW